MEKICSSCKLSLSSESFSKDSYTKDGLQYRCKDCQKQYRLKHLDRERETQRQRNKHNLETRRIKAREYNAKNKNRIRQVTKRYKEQNKEAIKLYYKTDKIKQYAKKYRQNNKEYFKTYNREYRLKNQSRLTFLKALRKKRIKTATPKWLTKKQHKDLELWYFLCKDLAWLSEEELQVDHIVPLMGKEVCGLHVPWNLQILTKTENIKKSNKI